MDDTTTVTAPRDRIAWRRLWWVAPLAAISAAGVNALIYLIASALDAIPDDVLVTSPSGEEPITIVPVVVASAIGTLAAAGVFALLGWLSSRPVGIFLVVAVVALVLSFSSPLSISDAPVDMVVALSLMHIVAAIISVGLLTTLSRSE